MAGVVSNDEWSLLNGRRPDNYLLFLVSLEIIGVYCAVISSEVTRTRVAYCGLYEYVKKYTTVAIWKFRYNIFYFWGNHIHGKRTACTRVFCANGFPWGKRKEGYLLTLPGTTVWRATMAPITCGLMYFQAIAKDRAERREDKETFVS